MKLKNITIILAATVLLCGMAGCGSKQEAQTTGPVAYPNTQPPISQMESGEFTFSYPDLGAGISFQETEDGLQLQVQLPLFRVLGIRKPRCRCGRWPLLRHSQ